MSIKLIEGEPTTLLADFDFAIGRSKDIPVPTHDQLEAFALASGLGKDEALQLMIRIALTEGTE